MAEAKKNVRPKGRAIVVVCKVAIGTHFIKYYEVSDAKFLIPLHRTQMYMGEGFVHGTEENREKSLREAYPKLRKNDKLQIITVNRYV